MRYPLVCEPATTCDCTHNCYYRDQVLFRQNRDRWGGTTFFHGKGGKDCPMFWPRSLDRDAEGIVSRWCFWIDGNPLGVDQQTPVVLDDGQRFPSPLDERVYFVEATQKEAQVIARDMSIARNGKLVEIQAVMRVRT